ncbi:hypothetical protein PPERSA_09440 [Pseudocohnilembus persalinus]|uniref:Uncharacterized protein n=1 Tax=Pseudocohnilembus persalinus TaxID=266149 RepID=A0A0V0Q9M0_PSEPJ|nr:hypothetical protein PPERSA_09440 [Pseudocohnilembus persalinus]|eukprot:KRW98915.1 hypothetical protein PPERSA_09440 [Pseudocohnilembus persalinus]
MILLYQLSHLFQNKFISQVNVNITSSKDKYSPRKKYVINLDVDEDTSERYEFDAVLKLRPKLPETLRPQSLQNNTQEPYKINKSHNQNSPSNGNQTSYFGVKNNQQNKQNSQINDKPKENQLIKYKQQNDQIKNIENQSGNISPIRQNSGFNFQNSPQLFDQNKEFQFDKLEHFSKTTQSNKQTPNQQVQSLTPKLILKSKKKYESQIEKQTSRKLFQQSSQKQINTLKLSQLSSQNSNDNIIKNTLFYDYRPKQNLVSQQQNEYQKKSFSLEQNTGNNYYSRINQDIQNKVTIDNYNDLQQNGVQNQIMMNLAYNQQYISPKQQICDKQDNQKLQNQNDNKFITHPKSINEMIDNVFIQNTAQLNQNKIAQEQTQSQNTSHFVSNNSSNNNSLYFQQPYQRQRNQVQKQQILEKNQQVQEQENLQNQINLDNKQINQIQEKDQLVTFRKDPNINSNSLEKEKYYTFQSQQDSQKNQQESNNQSTLDQNDLQDTSEQKKYQKQQDKIQHNLVNLQSQDLFEEQNNYQNSELQQNQFNQTQDQNIKNQDEENNQYSQIEQFEQKEFNQNQNLCIKSQNIADQYVDPFRESLQIKEQCNKVVSNLFKSIFDSNKTTLKNSRSQSVNNRQNQLLSSNFSKPQANKSNFSQSFSRDSLNLNTLSKYTTQLNTQRAQNDQDQKKIENKQNSQFLREQQFTDCTDNDQQQNQHSQINQQTEQFSQIKREQNNKKSEDSLQASQKISEMQNLNDDFSNQKPKKNNSNQFKKKNDFDSQSLQNQTQFQPQKQEHEQLNNSNIQLSNNHFQSNSTITKNDVENQNQQQQLNLEFLQEMLQDIRQIKQNQQLITDQLKIKENDFQNYGAAIQNSILQQQKELQLNIENKYEQMEKLLSSQKNEKTQIQSQILKQEQQYDSFSNNNLKSKQNQQVANNNSQQQDNFSSTNNIQSEIIISDAPKIPLKNSNLQKSNQKKKFNKEKLRDSLCRSKSQNASPKSATPSKILITPDQNSQFAFQNSCFQNISQQQKQKSQKKQQELEDFKDIEHDLISSDQTKSLKNKEINQQFQKNSGHQQDIESIEQNSQNKNQNGDFNQSIKSNLKKESSNLNQINEKSEQSQQFNQVVNILEGQSDQQSQNNQIKDNLKQVDTQNQDNINKYKNQINEQIPNKQGIHKSLNFADFQSQSPISRFKIQKQIKKTRSNSISNRHSREASMNTPNQNKNKISPEQTQKQKMGQISRLYSTKSPALEEIDKQFEQEVNQEQGNYFQNEKELDRKSLNLGSPIKDNKESSQQFDEDEVDFCGSENNQNDLEQKNFDQSEKLQNQINKNLNNYEQIEDKINQIQIIHKSGDQDISNNFVNINQQNPQFLTVPNNQNKNFSHHRRALSQNQANQKYFITPNNTKKNMPTIYSDRTLMSNSNSHLKSSAQKTQEQSKESKNDKVNQLPPTLSNLNMEQILKPKPLSAQLEKIQGNQNKNNINQIPKIPNQLSNQKVEKSQKNYSKSKDAGKIPNLQQQQKQLQDKNTEENKEENEEKLFENGKKMGQFRISQNGLYFNHSIPYSIFGMKYSTKDSNQEQFQQTIQKLSYYSGTGINRGGVLQSMIRNNSKQNINSTNTFVELQTNQQIPEQDLMSSYLRGGSPQLKEIRDMQKKNKEQNSDLLNTLNKSNFDIEIAQLPSLSQHQNSQQIQNLQQNMPLIQQQQQQKSSNKQNNSMSLSQSYQVIRNQRERLAVQKSFRQNHMYQQLQQQTNTYSQLGLNDINNQFSMQNQTNTNDSYVRRSVSTKILPSYRLRSFQSKLEKIDKNNSQQLQNITQQQKLLQKQIEKLELLQEKRKQQVEQPNDQYPQFPQKKRSSSQPCFPSQNSYKSQINQINTNAAKNLDQLQKIQNNQLSKSEKNNQNNIEKIKDAVLKQSKQKYTNSTRSIYNNQDLYGPNQDNNKIECISEKELVQDIYRNFDSKNQDLAQNLNQKALLTILKTLVDQQINQQDTSNIRNTIQLIQNILKQQEDQKSTNNKDQKLRRNRTQSNDLSIEVAQSICDQQTQIQNNVRKSSLENDLNYLKQEKQKLDNQIILIDQNLKQSNNYKNFNESESDNISDLSYSIQDEQTVVQLQQNDNHNKVRQGSALKSKFQEENKIQKSVQIVENRDNDHFMAQVNHFKYYNQQKNKENNESASYAQTDFLEKNKEQLKNVEKKVRDQNQKNELKQSQSKERLWNKSPSKSKMIGQKSLQNSQKKIQDVLKQKKEEEEARLQLIREERRLKSLANIQKRQEKKQKLAQMQTENLNMTSKKLANIQPKIQTKRQNQIEQTAIKQNLQIQHEYTEKRKIRDEYIVPSMENYVSPYSQKVIQQNFVSAHSKKEIQQNQKLKKSDGQNQKDFKHQQIQFQQQENKNNDDIQQYLKQTGQNINQTKKQNSLQQLINSYQYQILEQQLNSMRQQIQLIRLQNEQQEHSNDSDHNLIQMEQIKKSLEQQLKQQQTKLLYSHQLELQEKLNKAMDKSNSKQDFAIKNNNQMQSQTQNLRLDSQSNKNIKQTENFNQQSVNKSKPIVQNKQNLELDKSKQNYNSQNANVSQHNNQKQINSNQKIIVQNPQYRDLLLKLQQQQSSPNKKQDQKFETNNNSKEDKTIQKLEREDISNQIQMKQQNNSQPKDLEKIPQQKQKTHVEIDLLQQKFKASNNEADNKENVNQDLSQNLLTSIQPENSKDLKTKKYINQINSIFSLQNLSQEEIKILSNNLQQVATVAQLANQSLTEEDQPEMTSKGIKQILKLIKSNLVKSFNQIQNSSKMSSVAKENNSQILQNINVGEFFLSQKSLIKNQIQNQTVCQQSQDIENLHQQGELKQSPNSHQINKSQDEIQNKNNIDQNLLGKIDINQMEQTQ